MEAFPLRAVAHGERLTLTEHLGELRTRLLLSVAVLTVLFAGCLWQSRSLLHVLNVPLAQLRISSAAEGARGELPEALARSASAFTGLAHYSSLAPADQRAALNAARSLPAPRQPRARPGRAPPPPPRPPQPVARAPRRPRAYYARAWGAVLHLGHGRLRLRGSPGTAVPADPGVGVHLTGDRSRRAARGAPAPAVRAAALCDRCWVRVLPGPPAGREVPTGVQPRRLRRHGSGAR